MADVADSLSYLYKDVDRIMPKKKQDILFMVLHKRVHTHN